MNERLRGSSVTLLVATVLAMFLASGRAYGVSPPHLVLDINTQPNAEASGEPTAFRVAEAFVYFEAKGSFRGVLWRSDGTAAGTERLESVDVVDSVASGSRLFYVGRTVDRAGLWVSDGAVGGARLLLPFIASASPGPNRLTALGDLVLFANADSEHGLELWRSDGTEAGTVRVTDLAAGPADSLRPFENAPFAVVGNTAYFFANETAAALDLYTTDGTADGTRLVRHFTAPPNATGDFRARRLTAAAGRVWFAFVNGLGAQEIWVSDGSEAGTHRLEGVLVKAYEEGPLVTAAGESVYFAGGPPGEGAELWRTDGSQSGTELVSDLDPGRMGSNPRMMVAEGDTVFFLADQTTGPEQRVFGQLWRADGDALTVLKPEGGAYELVLSGNTLYLRAADATCPFVCPDTSRLWRSDGTLEGTEPVSPLDAGPKRPQLLTPFGTSILFAGHDESTGTELWRSDGTAETTVLVKDVFSQTSSSSPEWLTAVGERVFFAAYDGDSDDVWISDGTPAGTQALTDFEPQEFGRPSRFTALGEHLLFATTGETDRGLWSSDGTAGGTSRILETPDGIYDMVAAEGLAYVTNAGTTPALWRTDASAAGTSRIKTFDFVPTRPTAAGSRLYFELGGVSGVGLWTSDGTADGTRAVGGLPGGMTIERLNPFGDRLVFQLGNCNPLGVDPQRPLWIAHGASASPLADDTCIDSPMAEIGGRLLFLSRHSQGATLWSTDGTTPGTVPIAEVGDNSDASGLVVVGERVLFLAYDKGLNGVLWSSDGTAAGTLAVTEMRRELSKVPSVGFVAVNATQAFLLISQVDLVGGPVITEQEVWGTDGTSVGTHLLFSPPRDLGLVIDTFTRADLAATSELLFASLNGETTGQELWAAPVEQDHACPADCDEDGTTTEGEIIGALKMALGDPSTGCVSIGTLRRVTVDQVVASVACRTTQP